MPEPSDTSLQPEAAARLTLFVLRGLTGADNVPTYRINGGNDVDELEGARLMALLPKPSACQSILERDRLDVVCSQLFTEEQRVFFERQRRDIASCRGPVGSVLGEPRIQSSTRVDIIAGATTHTTTAILESWWRDYYIVNSYTLASGVVEDQNGSPVILLEFGPP